MKYIFFAFFLFSLILPAQDKQSELEINRKLDLILKKVSSLEQRVTRLESDNAVVKKEVEQAAKSAEEAKSTAQSQVIPSEEAEKKSFFEKLGNQLKTQETLAQGPWTDPVTWNQIRRNLTAFQVRKILGNPTKIKKSLNPRIEQVHYYTGDLDADGKMEIGFINFYRDRVVSFKSPH